MRLQNWQIHFEKFIADNRKAPFVWGKHDCCLFAANSVLAITGIDYAKDFRNSYDSAISAAKLIAEFGGLDGVASKLLNAQPVPVGYADVGDVLLASQEGRGLLAVCNGSTMLAPGLDGLITLETYTALKTWKI